MAFWSDEEEPFCRPCNRSFRSEVALDQHKASFCHTCGRGFRTSQSRQQHNTDRHRSVYCRPCDRLFQSENNLRQHLNSQTHRPRSVMCPLDGCKAGFVSNSALIAHIEANVCPSGIGLEELDADTHNSITFFTTHSSTDERTYCCPEEDCESTFRFLSAVLRHIEDEKCDAMHGFQIQNMIRRLVRYLPKMEAF